MDEPTDIPKLYTEHADTYQRFVRSLGYPQGLRAVFLKSPALVPGMRILDAGCGTGITTLALRQALEARGVSVGEIDAFDFAPVMLSRFRAMLARSDIEDIRLIQADVLKLDALPPTWSGYDLIVTASMLEYVPQSKLSTALGALHQRLCSGGTLMVFITRNNLLMRPLIGRGWSANLYTRTEVRVALEDSGFGDVSFGGFPFPYGYLDVWGHVVTARARS
jgi:ubiquinone/menaquinone biosynthesis C-methylase UbiE